MGLFNDFRNTAREGWSFTYKGSELLAPAQKKMKFYTA